MTPRRLRNGSGRDFYVTGSAALTMPALYDAEDSPPLQPTRSLILMSPHDDDSPTTPTLEAPPLSSEDRDTTPPGPSDEAAKQPPRTILPDRPPLTLEDTYLDRAIRVVASAGVDLARDRDERRLQHDAVLAAIVRSDENQTRNYALLRDELAKLKQSDLNQDAKLADLFRELTSLRERVTQNEADLKLINEILPQLEEALRDAQQRAAKAQGAPAEQG